MLKFPPKKIHLTNVYKNFISRILKVEETCLYVLQDLKHIQFTYLDWNLYTLASDMARARVFYYSYTVLDSPPDAPEEPVKIEYDQNHQNYILSWNSPKTSNNNNDTADLDYLVEMEIEPNSWIILGRVFIKKMG